MAELYYGHRSRLYLDDLYNNPEYASEVIQEAVRKGEEELAGNGRILLRPSGTEALIRVMVEAGTQEQAEKVASDIAKIVEMTKNA